MKHMDNEELIKIDWVQIQGGSFLMGSHEDEAKRNENESPQHKVTLSPFLMSRYLITYEQYEAFCKLTHYACSKPKCTMHKGASRKNKPVANISWIEASAFAKFVGGRLPTEAEWEYACRAGTVTPYNTGLNFNDKLANYGQLRLFGITTKVNKYRANNWGLYDMHGNVYEFCSDWYAPYSAEDQINPKGSENGDHKVIRGGSLFSDIANCRSAARCIYNVQSRCNEIGFRVVKDLPT